MTQNDFSLLVSRVIDTLGEIVGNHDRKLGETRLILPYPNWHSYRDEELLHKKISDYTGAEVVPFDFSGIKPGDKNSSEELIKHINKSDFTIIWCPTGFLLHGKMGVVLRRGGVDIDVAVNAGAPLTKKSKEALRKSKIPIEDVYGETEHPQLGGMYKQFGDIRGYKLPLTSQVNLVYDEETEELSYEGEGRFSYFSFGLEGQVIPGVYVGGVKGRLRTIDETHQIISDIKRVDNMKGGCADP
jgi:hypothetical protein